MTPVAAGNKRRKFDLKTFLSTIDGCRTIATAPKKQTIFVQGDSADSVFYLQKGKVRLTVVATSGKEATIGILNEGDFFGHGCLTGQSLRLFSATTMADCSPDANFRYPSDIMIIVGRIAAYTGLRREANNVYIGSRSRLSKAFRFIDI